MTATAEHVLEEIKTLPPSELRAVWEQVWLLLLKPEPRAANGLSAAFHPPKAAAALAALDGSLLATASRVCSCRNAPKTGSGNKRNWKDISPSAAPPVMAKPDKFLLDTSAFLALLEKEPGHDRVRELIEAEIGGELTLIACFVSLTEVQYIVTHKRGTQSAKETLAELKALPVSWVHSDEALCANAGEIKAVHRLSQADAFVAATALRQDAVLVHRDAQFAPLAATVSQAILPPMTGVATAS